MLPAAHALSAELDAEAATTRRVLRRVPDDRLAWQPHAKSMSLGQLAQHIASIPGGVTRMARLDGFDMATRPQGYDPCPSAAAALATFDASVSAAKTFLAEVNEEAARHVWRLTFGEREIFAVPRLDVIRTMCLNHLIHHRGELVVYLRLLDVPVPVVYGRSADENPFAQPIAQM
jgi:uncharacterized damage-inducible protein DinB